MPKIDPEWQILAYPKTAIPQRKIEAWAIADIMADVVSGRPSTWSGVLTYGTSGQQWSEWGRLGADFTLTNVGFARFRPDGGVDFNPSSELRTAAANAKGTGGFFVRPTIRPLSVNAPVGTINGETAPSGNGSLGWRVVAGDFIHSNSASSMRRSGLINTGNLNSPEIVSTLSPWDRGKGISLGIHAIGSLSPTRIAAAVTQISPTLRLALRQGMPPALERLTMVANGNVSTTRWDIWKTMPDAGECAMRGEFYDTSLYTMGGRLLWQINDRTEWIAEANESDVNIPVGMGQPEFIRVADMSALIGNAPITFATDNLRARVDVAQRQTTDASGNITPGIVSRTVTRTQAIGEPLTPYAVGNMPSGTTMPATISADGKDITYTVELNPTDDGMATPMLTQFYLAYKPVWTTPTGSAIDISPVVTKASVSHAHPPVQCGTAGSITVDVALMNALIPEAVNVLQDYCPVEIKGRWDGGPWKGITKGYFMGQSNNQSGYKNSALLELQIQGPMARLKDPAGKIDGNCVPADYHFMERLTALGIKSNAGAEDAFVIVRDSSGNALSAIPLSGRDKMFYGSEAAKLIIDQFLGPTYANTLNGDGDAMKYIPNGHPPLMTIGDMSGTWLAVAANTKDELTVGSLSKAQKDAYFKPPFGQDALTWITQFATDEHCIFTEGFADRNTSGWPVLMYGTREEIISNAILHRISGIDAEELLATAVSIQTQPEKDINRVLVWCNPFGGDAPPLAPAVVQGEARFRPNHPRSAERTWGRTLVLESKLATTAARAKAIAAIALMEADGDQFIYPVHTFLGDANCMTGDVFTVTDIGYLGGQDMWLRADRIDHEYSRDQEGGRTWFTKASLRTMSASEIARFQRKLGGF